jgi:hypothetical protein
MTILGKIPIPRATVDGRTWLGLHWVRDKGRSKGNTQFIEASHGCSEFERNSYHGGGGILLLRRVHRDMQWGKVLRQSLVTLHNS